MATNHKIVEALSVLIESSQIANKTNLAILEKLENTDDSGELVAQFTKAMESAKEPAFVPVGSGNSHRVPNSIVIKMSDKAILSPKLDFAKQWLQSNPQDATKSGRDLEKSALMDGKTISYKWWNKAKKMV